jgi:type II secretory pathway component PulJ
MRRARLNDQAGFTLVENLVACVVGVVVILATSAMLDLAPVLTSQVQGRVDSASRARIAMEQIVRELRSQVCLGPNDPAIVNGQDNSVTFYAFTGTGAYAPQMHTIAWNSQNNTITDSVYPGTGTPPAMTFPATPTRVDTLLTSVVPETGTPVLSYYAFAPNPPVVPSVLEPTPLTAAAAPSVARIAIRFVARPAAPASSTQSTDMQDDVYVRTWNPNDPNGPSALPCV